MPVQRGDVIRYIDAANVEWLALVRTPGPVADDAEIDLVQLRPAASLVATIVVMQNAVPSCRMVGTAPYWAL